MQCIPIEVADQEKIVRAIMCPSHLKKDNTLKPAAFRSKAGIDEVSVIRQTHLGSDFCKAKAKNIAASSSTITYAGLAVLSAQDIRTVGSNVQDSREEYIGHAHISHGLILTPNEPPESSETMRITERCRALVSKCTYHPDPDPSNVAWTGPTL